MAKQTDEELLDELEEAAEARERESALEYVGSLRTWLETHDNLTPAQREKAEEILDELS